ncbi:glucose-6-phosphate isomerase [Archaeoglobus sulfaticallidus PM70-1]|uniref:glucose-6-phosphate isomerase n=1 Tax=Archaeoglobus sulfaticallidus PM70-1 TaxID=387631 RepID=N0BCC1_9EURY|nr:glucose-6-phosphate isomerase family protein [Archaeoglobus sulfaticallidus]AGK61264.1 glucose-6-phosphate isomerase [Archaeoglobus sulfaticallidus PM70-1]
MEIEINGRRFTSETRFAFDLKPVLKNPEELEENFPAYEMFRDVYFSEEDRELILNKRLRYDYTFTNPGKIGDEFIKTFGHYHPEIGDGITYPEIYEIIEGRAIFVLQKHGESFGEIEDVVIVYAEEGDKIIIPPNYGHVMINPTDNMIKTANWVCRDFSSIYDPYKQMRGGVYYYTINGWVKNERYNAPEPKFVKPKAPKEFKGSMYDLIKTDRLDFLVDPTQNMDLFEEVFEEIDHDLVK